jgi:polyphosphate kinase
MNALTEASVIRELYAASQKGVPIDLVVRGACCLRPGLPGVSDTIRVRSIIARFLEHHRVFAFANNGDPQVLIGSADFMSRNFFRRVETVLPLFEAEHKKRVLREGLDLYLQDDQQAWLLGSDGSYTRAPSDSEPLSAQARLLAELANFVE